MDNGLGRGRLSFGQAQLLALPDNVAKLSSGWKFQSILIWTESYIIITVKPPTPTHRNPPGQVNLNWKRQFYVNMCAWIFEKLSQTQWQHNATQPQYCSPNPTITTPSHQLPPWASEKHSLMTTKYSVASTTTTTTKVSALKSLRLTFIDHN